MINYPDHITPRFLIDWLRENLSEKGVIGVGNFAVSYFSDYLFDFRYGTSTSGCIPPAKLGISSENVKHSIRYQATKLRPLIKLLNRLRFPAGSVFVDVGCGKGKVLLIASRYGFDKVIGIEFSHELCAIARNNADIYKRRVGHCSQMEVVESDILDYAMRGHENVFYLYNPFNGMLLQKFLENLAISMRETPRKTWLIYHISRHSDVIDKSGMFITKGEHLLGGTEFAVYESEPVMPTVIGADVCVASRGGLRA